MKLEIFEMEREQSVWENIVKYNLSESGIHPFTLKEVLSKEQIEKLFDIPIGYSQSNGIEELREAITGLYPDADIDNILVTVGSCEANFLSIWSILDKGDEFVVMLPNYMQVWGLAKTFGADVKPLWLKEKLDWAPDMDDLKKLVTSKTKLIAVCNPNNPTGAVLSENNMKEIVKAADSAGAWILSDEVYRGAEINGGDETPSFWGMYDKVLVSHGLSKAYALPGLRLGWLAGPKEKINQIWAYHDYTAISTATLSHHIAALALQPELRHRILSRNRKILKENHAILQEWMKNFGGMFNLIPPKAGAIAYPSYDKEIESYDLMKKLRDEKSVFIVPGYHFHMDRFVRIGIGNEKSEFEEALTHFGAWIDENIMHSA